MQKLISIFLCLFFGVVAFADPSPDEAFTLLVDSFVPGYTELKIAELDYGYEDNFRNIQDLPGIERQTHFFNESLAKLALIDRTKLSKENRYAHDTLTFEVKLDLERVGLEKKYKLLGLASVPSGGLFQVPQAREWYGYYVKKWCSTRITPQVLLALGNAQVKKVKNQMAVIQRRLGFEGKTKAFYEHLNDPSFIITDESKLLERFKDFRTLIKKNLARDFAPVDIPEVEILPAPEPNKDTPPGYYDGKAFYYNFFENRFQSRALDWLFIHEAIPGHHYQVSLAPKNFWIQKLFKSPGYTEGWGAYAEDLGRDVGAYADDYQHFGKWEWDLVRSARVVLDVGINYEGWSKERALDYWRKTVPNQSGIAVREVDRMFRWPAQVLAYKVGEDEFLRLRREVVGKMTIPQFHTAVLKRGALPLGIIREIVKDAE